MNEIFNEIINEASKGSIIIDGDSFPIGFNTIIYEESKRAFDNVVDNSFPVLVIKNMNLFIIKLKEYIHNYLLKERKFPSFSKDVEKNRIKLLITYLFANATTEDFINPIRLIDRNIAFLNDETFEYLSDGINIKLNGSFNNSSLEIKKIEQSPFMETSKRIDFSIVNGSNKFILPSITYGIETNSNNEKECYIYTLLHPKTKQEETEEQVRYAKKVSRELYKLNAGVYESESEEYKQYKNGESDYYPENISDISPSALLSLTIFLSLLSKENITNIRAVPYLPVRFLSREIFAKNIEDKERAMTLFERNIELQKNITDKFIRTFKRANFHLHGLNINAFPYEISEYMEMKLDNINDIENDILNDVFNSTLNQLPSNRKIK
ncbi:MAG: hypothetical protein ACM3O4_01345 [Ignavibacteriales bacterium]